MKIEAIGVDGDKHDKIVREYERSVFEYQRELEKFRDDEMMYVSMNGHEPTPPKEPKIPEKTYLVCFKDSMVERYQMTDGNRVIIYGPDFSYLTKYDDKLIEELDKLIEEN